MSNSIELLSAYVQDIEMQVLRSIEEYKKNTTKAIIESHIPDEPPRVVALHKGLDDETWHFPEVFEVYFPSLQRRSALITLYSFFENELEKLCERIRTQEKLRVKVTDMTDSGVKRSVLFLDKAAGINTGLDSNAWELIQDIKRIRNLVVHADGRLLDDRGERKKKESAIVEKDPLLEGDEEVLLRDGYLAEVLKAFDEYFNIIDKGIAAKYSSSLKPVA